MTHVGGGVVARLFSDFVASFIIRSLARALANSSRLFSAGTFLSFLSFLSSSFLSFFLLVFSFLSCLVFFLLLSSFFSFLFFFLLLLTSSSFFPASHGKILRLDNMNQALRNAEYAVRGELAIKAEKYKQDLVHGVKLPFSEIIHCNIGNPQQLNQKPITFFRQVLLSPFCLFSFISFRIFFLVV